jgi:putative flippase GtrA
MVVADARAMALTTPVRAGSPQPKTGGAPALVDVEIVVPVYNEQPSLAGSVNRLHTYLTENFPLSWVITVADNASTDGTWGTACRLSNELEGVRAVRLAKKGRGRALRTVWSGSDAVVVAYMDVDLSTDLGALLPLVAPLVTGHSDVAIGSRLAPGARVVRGAKRELISRAYNLLLRATLHNSFSDAQCGFKAMRTEVAHDLLPLVEDDGWFFDTELLVLAERNGLRVHEVAVDWVDDPDSRVEILPTARADIRGIARMWMAFARGRGLLPVAPTGPGTQATGVAGAPRGRPAGTGRQPSVGRAVHFAAVGVASTLGFALLFALLYAPVGAVAADIMALVLCAGGNLAANLRYTFAPAAGGRRATYYRRGAALAVLPLTATLAALGLLAAMGAEDLAMDIAVLTMVNLSVSALRYRHLSRASGLPPR